MEKERPFVEEVLKEKLKKEATGGTFPCRRAEKLAQDMGISLKKIGEALDILGIKIVQCQLGLFGYPSQGRIVQSAPAVAPDLKDAILSGLVNECLACEKAWALAQEFKIPRIEIASACECLKIKIKPCQLGAF